MVAAGMVDAAMFSSVARSGGVRYAPGRGWDLVQHPLLHDAQQILRILQQLYVLRRVAGHQQQIGNKTAADQSEILSSAHGLEAVASRTSQRLDRRVAEVIHEMLDVTRVLTVRLPRESIIPTDQRLDA